MIRLSLYMAMALLIALGAVWLSNNPGELMLQWRGWEVRLSFALFCLFALAYTLLIWNAYKLYRWFLTDNPLKSPQRRDAKRKRGLVALEQGWSALAIDDKTAALKWGKKALSALNGEASALRLLVQASKDKEHEKYLDQLMAIEDSEIYGLKIQIEAHMKQGESENALEKAHLLHTKQPKNPWVMKHLIDLHAALSHWDEAREMLKAATRLKALSPEEVAHTGAVLDYGAACETDLAGQKKAALNLALSALKKEPGFHAAAVLAARLHVALGDVKKAEKLLLKSWGKDPCTEISEPYLALYAAENAAGRLARVQKLISNTPEHMLSRHLLARCAIDAQKWPLAKDALDQITENGEATASTHILRARLIAAQKGDLEAINQSLKQAEEAANDLEIKKEAGS